MVNGALRKLAFQSLIYLSDLILRSDPRKSGLPDLRIFKS